MEFGSNKRKKSDDARKDPKTKTPGFSIKNFFSSQTRNASPKSSDHTKEKRPAESSPSLSDTRKRDDDQERKRFEYKPKPSFMKRSYSDRDTSQYREGYPGKKDNPRLQDNLLFYKNSLQSIPNGDYIDEIHKRWYGDYARLERHHGYIQWLFPIREQGMNMSAQELQLHEAVAIRDDPACRARVLKSYELMLDFYGMRLQSAGEGWLTRADNWQERFAHLNRSYHNYLRITRILKSLGELGFEQFKAPFIEFMLVEALDKKTLQNCEVSCTDYWMGTVKSDEERDRLRCLADQLTGSKL